MKMLKTAVTLVSLLVCVTAQAGEKIYFVHTDHLGTPQAMTDAAQNTVWKMGDDPFGGATPAVEQVVNNIRFPGQYYDAESGLHYNWNRYYDAGTGRYVTSDPIGLEGGINTYGYVGGNPLYWIDRDGLKPTGSSTGARNRPPYRNEYGGGKKIDRTPLIPPSGNKDPLRRLPKGPACGPGMGCYNIMKCMWECEMPYQCNGDDSTFIIFTYSHRSLHPEVRLRCRQITCRWLMGDDRPFPKK